MLPVKLKIVNTGKLPVGIRLVKKAENSKVTPATGAYPKNCINSNNEFTFVLSGDFDWAERFVFAGRDTPNFVNLNYISNSTEYTYEVGDDGVTLSYNGVIANNDLNYDTRRIGAFLKLYAGEPEAIFAEPTVGSGFERIFLGQSAGRITLSEILATKGMYFNDENYYVPIFGDNVTLAQLIEQTEPSYISGVIPEPIRTITSINPDVISPITSGNLRMEWDGVVPTVGTVVNLIATPTPADAGLADITYTSSNSNILEIADPTKPTGVIKAVGQVTVTAAIRDRLNNLVTANATLDTYFNATPLTLTVDTNYSPTFSANITGNSPSAYMVIDDTDYTEIVSGSTVANITETLRTTGPTNVKLYWVNGDTGVNVSASKGITEVTKWAGILTDKLDIRNLPNLTRVPGTLFSQLKSVVGMLEGCTSFDFDISGWGMSRFTSLNNILKDCTSFNQPLDRWDVSNVTSMQSMLQGAVAFNQPLSSWNTSKVTNMASAFFGCAAFTQDIGTWDVSKVTDFAYMFKGATNFNANLITWNVGSAQDMTGMFSNVADYTHRLNGWCVENILSRPTDFGVPTALSPVWGTCPRASDITSIVGMPTELYNTMSYSLSIDANYPVISTVWAVAPADKAIIESDGSLTLLSVTPDDTVRVTCTVNGYYLVEVSAPVVLAKTPLSIEVNSDENATIQVEFSSPVDIDWGDGSTSNNVTTAEHEYTAVPTTPMEVKPLSNTPITAMVSGNVQRVLDWGDYAITNIQFGKVNSGIETTILDVPLPLPITMTDLSGMFTNCLIFNQDLSSIDLTNVTSINGMFYNAITYNRSIEDWDLAGSKITELNNVFYNAKAFNQPMNGLDTSKITSMSHLFAGSGFNQPLNNWDVSRVSNMTGMFKNAAAMLQDLSMWCVTNVASEPLDFATGSKLTTYLKPIWGTCEAAVPPVTNLDPFTISMLPDGDEINFSLTSTDGGVVSIDWGDGFIDSRRLSVGVNDISRTYPASPLTTIKVYTSATLSQLTVPTQTTQVLSWGGATITNARLGTPSLITVPNTLPATMTDLTSMFEGAETFNSANVSNWDTSNVLNMSLMFKNATAFNQPLNGLDVSNVTDMSYMFEGAQVFNQALGDWNVANVTDMTGTFSNATAFDQDLSQWCVANITSKPNAFDEGSALVESHLPVWGTCPGAPVDGIPPLDSVSAVEVTIDLSSITNVRISEF